MKICFLSIFVLFCACKETKKIKVISAPPIISVESFKIQDNKGFNYFIREQDHYIHGKKRYPLDKSSVESWLENISRIEQLKQKKNIKTLSLAALKSKLIEIQVDVNTKYVLEGFYTKGQGFIKRSEYYNKKFLKGKGLYLTEKDFKKIFIESESLRRKKLGLESFEAIFYDKKGEIHQLSASDADVIFNTLQGIKIIGHLDTGIIDEHILNRFKFGYRENNNIVGILQIKNEGKVYRFHFAKPKPKEPLTYLYQEGIDEIDIVNFNNWVKITRILQKY